MVSGFLIVRQEADDGDIRLFLDKDYYDIFYAGKDNRGFASNILLVLLKRL